MSASYTDWRDRLATANDPRFWPIAEIDRMLSEGRAQFWATGDGALVTRIARYPGGAVAIEALAAAGTLDAIHAIAPNVEEWARQLGATHMMVSGRPGWARAHPDGWRHYQSSLIKELSDGN